MRWKIFAEETDKERSFLVDIGIGSAREIDALERTAFRFRKRRGVRFDCDRAVTLDDDRVSRREFMNERFILNVEGCLNHRTFGSDNRHFVVHIVERGTDSCGVAEHKGVAVSDESGDNVSAVPVFAGVAEDFHNVQILGDIGFRLAPGHAAGDALLFHPDRGFVEIVSDLFEHGHRVGTVFRMLTDVDETLEELFRVGEVEVSGDH